MAQSVNFQATPAAIYAKNIGITTLATETIVLDQVACLGLRNIGITVVNHSGATSAAALYSSPDGINWTTVSSFSTFAVSTGAAGHTECTAVNGYLRLTLTGVSVSDVYLHASQ